MEDRIKEQITLIKLKIKTIDEITSVNPLKNYAYLEGNKAAFKECVKDMESLLELDRTKPLPY